jgi:hypothetical protein
MSELKNKIMITRKYLEQVYELLSKQLDTDVVEYDMNTLPGAIKVDSLGVISLSVRNIEYELKQIEDAISLSEDMEKQLVSTK